MKKVGVDNSKADDFQECQIEEIGRFEDQTSSKLQSHSKLSSNLEGISVFIISYWICIFNLHLPSNCLINMEAIDSSDDDHDKKRIKSQNNQRSTAQSLQLSNSGGTGNLRIYIPF